MPKIRVLAIPSDEHGVGKFRMFDPYNYIKNFYSEDFTVDVIMNVPASDLFFKNYDIVTFHSFIHKTSHEDNVKRIKWLQKNGIKVIMDIDDYWALDPRHPMYQQVTREQVFLKKIELLQIVDYVTTTTSFFANSLRKKLHIKNIVVFPNAVNPDEPQFTPQISKSDRLRFGWLGGSSHLYDIELMRDGINKVLSNYDSKIQFVLCGFDTRGFMHVYDKVTKQKTERPILPTETVWYKYEKIFTKNYTVIDEEYKKYLMAFTDIPYDTNNKPYIRRWTRDINSYATNYNHFDVSLAPLVNTVFNNNKSELKIIEAGFHKKPIISSDVVPYNTILVNAFNQGKFVENGNALLVDPMKNHKLWDIHMKNLILNPNLVEDLGNRLYETVKDKYSLKNVSKDRTEFFKSIIN